MREFQLPFKPEELLAQPSDGRLWASDLPPVDDWASQDVHAALDELIGRLLSSNGKDLAEDASFSLIFALLQAWQRLDDGIHPRIVDLLADAARRLIGEASRLRKAAKPSKSTSSGDKGEAAIRELRTAAKVAAFFLRWASERVIRQPQNDAGRARRGRIAKGGSLEKAQESAAVDEAKEAQKAMERQRCAVLGELTGLISRGAMPWLWSSDPAAWQQVAQATSDGGFVALDKEEALKHRETKQAALRCITDPLLQEGHQHSNLLVATVSKLIHGLRGGEGGAPFAAEALVLAHNTPLPRLFLFELTQHCTAQELTSQGAFQRSLGAFLVLVAEKLPHIVLANISVLLPLLDVDCYPLRQAIVESIGNLLSAEGRKLPSGARCAQPQDDQVPEGENAGESQALPAQTSGSEATFTMAAATKKDLLETLLARSVDKSVWVRYKVLQTLASLASNTKTAALPKEQWPRVLDIATRRMQDTASMSRKAAMQLLRTLVEFHPYGPALKGAGDERAKAEKLLMEVHERLKKLQSEEVADIEDEAAENGVDLDESGEPAKRRRMKSKTMTEQSIVCEVDRDLNASGALEDDGDDGASARHEARQRQRESLRRMQDCYSQRVHFVELLDAAEARIRGLLASKTSTDVTEAICVVVELRLRGVPAAMLAFDQVLGLVWSRHANIKDAAVDAFYRMHLEGRDAASAANSLLEMIRDGCSNNSWTYTHLASVQELIQQSAERGLVSPKELMPALLAALAGSSSCSASLRALTALAASPEGSSSLVAALPHLRDHLGSGGSSAGTTVADRLERVKLLGHLLLRLQSFVKVPLSQENCAILWALSQHATRTVVEHFVRGEVPAQWFGAAQVAMDLSFEMASVGKESCDASQRSPDKLWEQILGRMLRSLLGGNDGTLAVAPLADATGEENAMREDEEALASASGVMQVRNLSVPQLGCVAFVAGHLALRMLVFLEGMHSALKKLRLAEEEVRMAEQREKKKEKAAEKVKAAGKKGKGAKAEEEEDAGAEASLGGVGQEEREAEMFADIAEHGLLYGKLKILDQVKPLLFACLLNPALRQEPILRRLGAIGLCKFMTVSKRFCQENLQLLFSVLFPKGGRSGVLGASLQEAEESAASSAGCGNGLMDDLTLRQSLLVAVGDLLFRHPNVVEPWTGRLYATLGVSSEGNGGQEAEASDLRLTALLVLTHLVLNDLVKPRAVLLVRALWLTACTDAATARVARTLFQELSKRSTNVVYNLLPEIIARLPEHEASAGRLEGGATGRVQYIMQFVEKEKQVEGLVEKLSVRLEQAANGAGAAQPEAHTQAQGGEEMADGDEETALKGENQKDAVACLAHALGSMTYTDRCILRLHDVVVVRKAVNVAISYHPVVSECLLGVVEKARKPRPGKEKGEGPADADAAAAPAEGGEKAIKGGASAAAVAALDAIEQTVNGLAGAKDKAEDVQLPIAEETVAAQSAPIADSGGRGGGRGGDRKRKAVAADADAEPGFADEDDNKAGGRGRGKGRGKGRKAAEDKENLSANPKGKENLLVKGAVAGKIAGGAAAGKRRKAVAADDDQE